MECPMERISKKVALKLEFILRCKNQIYILN